MRRRPFSLVADSISHDTVQCLEELVEMARKGELIGFVYGAMLRNRNYFLDATGEADRNPTFTRGIIGAIDDELSRRVHSTQARPRK